MRIMTVSALAALLATSASGLSPAQAVRARSIRSNAYAAGLAAHVLGRNHAAPAQQQYGCEIKQPADALSEKLLGRYGKGITGFYRVEREHGHSKTTYGVEKRW